MKVALIQLPHFYGNGESRPPECYPLGLGYISNSLRAAGIVHKGIDLWGMQYSPSEALAKVDFSGYDFFGISAYVTQYKYLKEFSLRLKERYPDTPIICGGPGPTFSREIILAKTGVDVCVLREGEATIAELLDNFKCLEHVKGIAYLKDGKVLATSPRPAIENLDSLEFPNRELFDLEQIIRNSAKVRSDRAGKAFKGSRSTDIVAGRGCPYSCSYCSKTFSGLRLRAVENVISEAALLKERYGVNHLSFNDELLLVNRKRTLELCAGLKKLNLRWTCQGRINQVDREILGAMKDAGCIEVGYGVESISQGILDAMNKRQDAKTIAPVIKMTKESGITPIVQYMFGYPGENDETIARTIEFFKEIDYPFISFTTTPIPGTKLYQDCVNNGLIKDEEDYLLRLDSGYNITGAMVNMTGFTDSEFLSKKKRLKFRVTHNYLKKRPAEYLKYIMGVAGRKLEGAVRKAGITRAQWKKA